MFPMVVVQPASLRVSVIKESALKIFDSLPKLIEHLGEYRPPEESVWADAKTFVFKLYSHGTDGVDIDKARAAAFRKVKKNLDSLPLTGDGFHLHLRRANCQWMHLKKRTRPSAIPDYTRG